MTGRRYYASERDVTRPVTVRSGDVWIGTDPHESGTSRRAEIRGLADRRIVVRLDGRSAVGFAERRDGVWHVELEGREYRVRVEDERTHRLRALVGEAVPVARAVELRAPMPGLVVRVAVVAGDHVRAGDGLVVMEAMKMENELRAERGGVVAEVHVTEGTTVERDTLLVTFDHL